MKITLNGITIGSYTDIKLTPPLQGMFTPPIRTSSGEYSGNDGGYVSAQFYAPREIVINVTIDALTCPDAEQRLCSLQNALPIRQVLPLTYTNGVGSDYYTDVYFINMEMDITNNRYYKAQITLLAPDPYFYRVAANGGDGAGWQQDTIYKLVGGGYVTPYILPVIWEAGATPTLINNPNDILVYPQIVLTGKFTNPRITNATTGAYIEISASLGASDTVVIDLYHRTVTLNGGSILTSVAFGSSWWSLQPGDNLIALTSDQGDDEAQAIIRYRIPYTGVNQGVC